MRYTEIIMESFPLARKEWSQETDLAVVDDYLAKFRDRVTRGLITGEKKDINYWRKQGWRAFTMAVDAAMEKHSRKQMRRGKVQGKNIHVYSDDRFDAYVPLDEASNVFFDKQYDMPYCTSGENKKEFYERMSDLRYDCRGLVYGIPKTDNDATFAIDFIVAKGQVRASFWDGDNEEIGYDDEAGSPDTDIGQAEFEKLTGVNTSALFAAVIEHTAEIRAVNEVFAKAESEKAANQQSELSSMLDNGVDEQKVADLLKSGSELHAARYARNLGVRIPALEDLIASYGPAAIGYAEDVIKGRWPKGEATIAKSAYDSSQYAAMVVKGRFKEGEPAIFNAPDMALRYACRFKFRLPANVEKRVFADQAALTDKQWSGELYIDQYINQCGLGQDQVTDLKAGK